MAASAVSLLLLGLLPCVLSMYGPLEMDMGLSDAAKYYLMCQHNKLRSQLARGALDSKWKSQPKAANMQCLCWCEELVPKAQQHASDCNGPPHDPRSGRSSANFPDVGQNVMQTLPTSPLDESLLAFLEEINGYDFDSNTCDPSKAGPAGVCGHYTALMWAGTQCLGCAYDKCAGSAHGRLVCNYGPGGNLQGKKPYEAGEPCTKCNDGQSCLDGGLCCTCANGRCGSQATAVASSSSSSCQNAAAYAAMCPQVQAAGYCAAGSPYYLFAQANCKKSCGFCGGVDLGKVCTAGFNVTSQHCSRHSTEGARECKEGNGLFYTGVKTTTASGYTCRQWQEATSYYHDFEFPERSRSAAKNYCRNPGSSGTAPWCYVAAEGKTWEYCSIPDC